MNISSQRCGLTIGWTSMLKAASVYLTGLGKIVSTGPIRENIGLIDLKHLI